MSATVRLRYQAQDSTQTLAEGLEEYYAANRGIIARPADLPPESRALFANHDAGHVIFGLTTSLADEAMADWRIILGTDVGLRRYMRYLLRDAQAKAIFKQIGYGKVLASSFATLPRAARAIWELRRMKKRWPWNTPASFLARPLGDLRREFGINVI